jgi:predicted  nucleic acid-binding Zn-ribbon protein
MKQIMENLLALQKVQLQTQPLSPENAREILKLREPVPAPVLAHFDRLIARGKKGVAVARNGACGECHLRLPSGTMAALAYTNEIHLCDNCGRYLYLPEDEPLGLTNPSPPVEISAKPRATRVR